MNRNILLNKIGFVILGIANTFGYTVMLTAAFDLLAINRNDEFDIPKNRQYHTQPANISSTRFFNNDQEPQKYCNQMPTSTILIADILPSLLIKLAFPLFLISIRQSLSMTFAILLYSMSFVITGFASHQSMVFLGVVSGSVSAGLADQTTMSIIPNYKEYALASYSMGSGLSGLICALSYASLSLFLGLRAILLLMLVMPAALALAFFVLIKPDEMKTEDEETEHEPRTHVPAPVEIIPNSEIDSAFVTTSTAVRLFNNKDDDEVEIKDDDSRYSHQLDVNIVSAQHNDGVDDERSLLSRNEVNLTNKEKIDAIPMILKYFIPMFVVYFLEYFINQGLYELIYFKEEVKLDHASQYRWFQVAYQIGVFVSRSSLAFVKIRRVWIMSCLQLLNTVIFLMHVLKIIHFPSFNFTILFIIYEGLMSGFLDVNTYYKITKEVERKLQVFVVTVVGSADALGISLAAFIAIPVHDIICKMYESDSMMIK